jgi:hypothetical protein
VAKEFKLFFMSLESTQVSHPYKSMDRHVAWKSFNLVSSDTVYLLHSLTSFQKADQAPSTEILLAVCNQWSKVAEILDLLDILTIDLKTSWIADVVCHVLCPYSMEIIYKYSLKSS